MRAAGQEAEAATMCIFKSLRTEDYATPLQGTDITLPVFAQYFHIDSRTTCVAAVLSDRLHLGVGQCLKTCLCSSQVASLNSSAVPADKRRKSDLHFFGCSDLCRVIYELDCKRGNDVITVMHC